jgi:hypothetical protein
MIKGFRRTAATAAAVLAVGAGSVALGASSASAVPTGIGRCTAGNLAVWVNADSADGTAGTTYFNLEYTNISGVTCYLNGFPGVSATNGNGKQIGLAAAHDNSIPAKTIDIAPGMTAHSALGYHDILVDPSCKPQTASYLKVFAPNTVTARHAFVTLSLCTTGQANLSVQRVQSGV